jgi:hypothetical protein
VGGGAAANAEIKPPSSKSDAELWRKIDHEISINDNKTYIISVKHGETW